MRQGIAVKTPALKQSLKRFHWHYTNSIPSVPYLENVSKVVQTIGGLISLRQNGGVGEDHIIRTILSLRHVAPGLSIVTAGSLRVLIPVPNRSRAQTRTWLYSQEHQPGADYLAV